MSDIDVIEKMISLAEKISMYISNIDYDGVNLKVIWETITEDLPLLSKQLKSLIEN